MKYGTRYGTPDKWRQYFKKYEGIGIGATTILKYAEATGVVKKTIILINKLNYTSKI